MSALKDTDRHAWDTNLYNIPMKHAHELQHNIITT